MRISRSATRLWNLWAQRRHRSCAEGPEYRRRLDRSGGLRERVTADAALEVELALEVGVGRVLEAQLAALEDAHERLDELAVKLGPRDATQLGDRLGLRHGRPVGVARGHHVVGVGDRDHPREQRDVL